MHFSKVITTIFFLQLQFISKQLIQFLSYSKYSIIKLWLYIFLFFLRLSKNHLFYLLFFFFLTLTHKLFQTILIFLFCILNRFCYHFFCPRIFKLFLLFWSQSRLRKDRFLWLKYWGYCFCNCCCCFCSSCLSAYAFWGWTYWFVSISNYFVNYFLFLFLWRNCSFYFFYISLLSLFFTYNSLFWLSGCCRCFCSCFCGYCLFWSWTYRFFVLFINLFNRLLVLISCCNSLFLCYLSNLFFSNIFINLRRRNFSLFASNFLFYFFLCYYFF